MSIRFSFLALALVPLATGCAAMFTGTTNDVTFLSEPPGARIQVADQSGTTPCTLKISKRTKEAVVQLPGEPEQTIELKRKMQGGFVLLDLLFTPGFGLSGLLVDGATGAWYSHEGLVRVGDVPVVAKATGEPVQVAEASAR